MCIEDAKSLFTVYSGMSVENCTCVLKIKRVNQTHSGNWSCYRLELLKGVCKDNINIWCIKF